VQPPRQLRAGTPDWTGPPSSRSAQLYLEARAADLTVRSGDGSAVALDDLSRDREAEPDVFAPGFPWRIGEEAVEDAREVCSGMPGPESSIVIQIHGRFTDTVTCTVALSGTWRAHAGCAYVRQDI